MFNHFLLNLGRQHINYSTSRRLQWPSMADKCKVQHLQLKRISFLKFLTHNFLYHVQDVLISIKWSQSSASVSQSHSFCSFSLIFFILGGWGGVITKNTFVYILCIYINIKKRCHATPRDFFLGIKPHCLLWIAMAKYHVWCLSAMGVILPSGAQWVRSTRPGCEEAKLLPLSHRRTCFEQRKVVVWFVFDYYFDEGSQSARPW